MTPNNPISSSNHSSDNGIEMLFKRHEKPNFDRLFRDGAEAWMNTAYLEMMEQVEAGAVFTEEHRRTFTQRFDPFQNVDHPIWSDLGPPYVAGRWTYLQHLHGLSQYYSDVLFEHSRHYHPVKDEQLSFPDDPIREVIEKSDQLSDTQRQIFQLLETGVPFTHRHHQLLIRKFSPFHNLQHPDWYRDAGGNVLGNHKAAILSHEHVCVIAGTYRQTTYDLLTSFYQRQLVQDSRKFAEGSAADHVETTRKDQSTRF